MASNGHLTSAELSPIAGGTSLRHDAAAAWNAMAAEIYRDTGTKIIINGPDSAYRSYARQVYWRNYWCSRGACQNAAVPGTSNHGWGIAVDIPAFVASLIGRYGAKYGWRRECTDAPWEAWHFKWCGGYSGPDPGPDYNSSPKERYPTLSKGKRGPAVKRLQRLLNRWNDGMTKPRIDGDFGDTTKNAVEDFQRVHGLKRDGAAGKNTWHQLRRRDYLYRDERTWWNKLKLIRTSKGGANNPQQIQTRDRLIEAIEKRVHSIYKVSQEHGWAGEHRGKRFKILRAVALMKND